jgi:hypothetical protein
MDRFNVIRLLTQLHRTALWCIYAQTGKPLTAEDGGRARKLLEECSNRVQGNRDDERVPTPADVRLVIAGVLRKCIELVEGEPPA